jgi:hypothetical protein
MSDKELGDKLSATYDAYVKRLEYLQSYPCRCMADHDPELRRAVLEYSKAIKDWHAPQLNFYHSEHRHRELIARWKALGFEVVE